MKYCFIKLSIIKSINRGEMQRMFVSLANEMGQILQTSAILWTVQFFKSYYWKKEDVGRIFVFASLLLLLTFILDVRTVSAGFSSSVNQIVTREWPNLMSRARYVPWLIAVYVEENLIVLCMYEYFGVAFFFGQVRSLRPIAQIYPVSRLKKAVCQGGVVRRMLTLFGSDSFIGGKKPEMKKLEPLCLPPHLIVRKSINQSIDKYKKPVQRKGGEMKQHLAWNSGKPDVQS